MSLNILLLSLACLVYSQTTYSVIYQYDDCNNKNVVSWLVNPTDPARPCTSSPDCACTANNLCSVTLCDQTDFPDHLDNALIVKQFATSADCSGEPYQTIAQRSSLCFGVEDGTSIMQTCSGDGFTMTTFNNPNCGGDGEAHRQPFSGSACLPLGPGQSGQYSCTTSAACIHVDTKFTYKGNKHDFQNIPDECTIPHVVTRDGVKISTSCVGELRLTHDHLVMTPEGWKEAGSIKVGDSLYSRVGGEQLCSVTSVQTEKSQKYSGLNCVESEIEADGYWISTFGSVHRVPAFWMKYASQIVGVQTASNVGDYFASLFCGYY